ncbi:MAG: hypothetical protein HQK70_04050 [Desulfamplus sp.]|nr:hypothetical protein [Desulfamplus sp.]
MVNRINLNRINIFILLFRNFNSRIIAAKLLMFCLTLFIINLFSPFFAADCSKSIFTIFKLSAACAEDSAGTWSYYKSHFISADGRVTDHFQNNISHSEGQGYGLLLALHNNDKATFEKIIHWTQNNIMVRKDGLAAWSWGKRDNGEWGVIDYNNATDGDIIIAWALLIGGEKWENSSWISWAEATIDRIRQSLTIKKDNKTVLLPGYYGFTNKLDKSSQSDKSNQSEKADKKEKSESINIRINTSYFIFPAFNAFADHTSNNSNSPNSAENRKFWKELYSSSITILKQSLAGKMTLPPDWLNIDEKGSFVLDKSKGAEFSYDAIRVPLYLAMADDKKSLEIFSSYIKFCDKLGYIPAKVDLLDEQISIQEASAGFHAVLAKCAAMVGEKSISESLMKKAEIKIKQEKDDYYSNTLYLLANLL